eukprot:366574-Chlamydomonas_euryale.AAC.4
MLFKVESTSSGRSTHCGVLEFVAEEGVVYMPHWVSIRPTQKPWPDPPALTHHRPISRPTSDALAAVCRMERGRRFRPSEGEGAGLRQRR